MATHEQLALAEPDADAIPQHRAGKPFADAPPLTHIEAWRSKWWNPEPPGLSRLVEDLPIFHGSDHAVRGWAEALCGLCASIEAHINDNCRGRVPRWMKLPKVLFGVESITLVRTEAKDSRSHATATDLVADTRLPITPEQFEELRLWTHANPEGRLVTHKPFVDLAAHVYTAWAEKPQRVRFYAGGLVLACAPTQERIVLADHRGVERKRRSNRYQSPLLEIGTTRIYGVIDPPGR